MVWISEYKFKKSIVMNVANITHEEKEVKRTQINQIKYNWKK